VTVLLAIDQGSSSSRCVVYDGELHELAQASRPLASSFPADGWVEHDPHEILASVVGAVTEAVGDAAVSWDDVTAIGLTAQTETFVVWDRASGEPVYPAVSWRDGRAAELCDRLRAAGHEDEVRARTGLPLESAFSAPKLRWVLDHVPAGQARAEAGELMFGDVNCWLIWRLSGGTTHIAEPSMAARTMLFDTAGLVWDTGMLSLFGIPPRMLPGIVPTVARLATTDPAVLGGRALISASIGDQQSALFGQRCWLDGMAKLTLGTGAFFWCHAGSAPPKTVPTGVVASCAWQVGRQFAYAFEGFVPNAGGVVTWLRELGALGAGDWPVIRDGAVQRQAGQVGQVGRVGAGGGDVGRGDGGGGDGGGGGQGRGDGGGLWCVPALFGLGTPHWGAPARADIIGLDAGSTGADLAEAALLGVAHQVADAIEAVAEGLPGPLGVIRVDGGLSRNDSFLQAIADLTGVTLERTGVTEATALGAAALAGLGAGVWSLDSLGRLAFDPGHQVRPSVSEAVRGTARSQWKNVLAEALGRWQVAGPGPGSAPVVGGTAQ
jgi:glycerol kinase